jgi:DNA polymerase I-like protein with 3'-5' exonuclease and polymerase domains
MVNGKLIKDTNKKTQKRIRMLPVMQALAKYRGFGKGISTYGYSYLESLHPKTGKLHPKLNSYGAESGRPTSNKPNVLNIPRDVRYRNAFITDSGRMLATVDHSAAELRILAELSGDPVMTTGFNSGVDFHCYVATKIFKREVTKKNENAHLRQPTKELNFGIAYGMRPNSLWEKLNGNGYSITLDETKAIFNDYNSEFKVAIDYLRRCGNAASRDLYLQTITGRMRFWRKPTQGSAIASLKKELGKEFNTIDQSTQEWREMVNDRLRGQQGNIEREGGNFPIQEMNATFSKVALYEIRKEYKRRKLDARMYNFIYDEIVVDTAKDCAEEAFEIQKRIMVETAHRYLKKVPMEVEGHLDTKWTK